MYTDATILARNILACSGFYLIMIHLLAINISLMNVFSFDFVTTCTVYVQI